MIRRLILSAMALTVFAVLVLIGAGTASATPTPTVSTTKTVDWLTTLAPGATKTTDENSVTWPQTYTPTVPTCGVVQQDVYRYDSKTKARVDALIAHGKLDKPDNDTTPWTDEDFIISWSFPSLPGCVTPTPTPTMSTPTPMPSVSTPVVPSTPALVSVTTPVLPNTGLPINPILLGVIALGTIGIGAGIYRIGRER